MEIFKLIGSVMVDTAKAQESISKVSDKAEGVGKKLSDGVKTAGKWAAGIAGAAVAAGGAMLAAAKDTAAQADAIDKASQRMKMGAESYQELAYAAEMSGVELGALEAAAKKLDGTGLNMDDAMAQIMAIGDAEERAAKAAELFGDSVAYKMTPLLNAGEEGFEAMKQEARDLGLVMSEDSVAAGAAMGDQFAKVQKSIDSVKTQLVEQFMPVIMKILDWVVENLPMIQDMIGTVMTVVMNLIDFLLPYIEPVLSAITSLIQGFFALLNGDTEGFINGIKGFFEKLIPTMLDLGKKIFTGLWNGLKSVWSSITGWISGILDNVVGWFSGIGDKIAGFFGFGGKSDGAHASGLATVPYDGYQATLHRGETVLNPNDTSRLISLLEGSGAAQNAQPINITVQSVLDGRVIGESSYQYMRRRERAVGV